MDLVETHTDFGHKVVRMERQGKDCFYIVLRCLTCSEHGPVLEYIIDRFTGGRKIEGVKWKTT